MKSLDLQTHLVSRATLPRGLSDDMQSIPRARLSDSLTISSMRGKLVLPSIDRVDLMESLLSRDLEEPLSWENVSYLLKTRL